MYCNMILQVSIKSMVLYNPGRYFTSKLGLDIHVIYIYIHVLTVY